jgi:hypothetical protein
MLTWGNSPHRAGRRITNDGAARLGAWLDACQGHVADRT